MLYPVEARCSPPKRASIGYGTTQTGYGVPAVGCSRGSRYVDGFMVLWLLCFCFYCFMVLWFPKITIFPFHVFYRY